MTTATTATIDARDLIPVGTIFVSSWGYDQTNIDFYRVEKVTAKMVTIVHLETVLAPSAMQTSQPYQDKVFPGNVATGNWVDGVYDPDAVRTRRVKVHWGTGPDGNPAPHLKLASYEYAYPWNGHAPSQTGIGFGH